MKIAFKLGGPAGALKYNYLCYKRVVPLELFTNLAITPAEYPVYRVSKVANGSIGAS